ncbi:MAG TPA: hypothetical protein VN414_07375 [Methanosarcina sp.]|nr:hypothetical protein [Methanosarcina sp.]
MTERVFATAKTTESEQKCSGSCKHKPSFDSSGSSADRILQLQRTAGNQALQRLIKSGTYRLNSDREAKDICKLEADRVTAGEFSPCQQTDDLFGWIDG